jgi:hypothetical protein
MYMDNQSIATPCYRIISAQNVAPQKPASPHKKVRLEISAKKLLSLLDAGALCAADLRCLDCESKHCVREICLRNCLRSGAADFA